MLTQILVAILIVAVALLVATDLARTKNEPDAPGYEVRPRTINDTHGDRTGAYFREPFRTGVPAAGHDASLGRHPEQMDPPAADFQPARSGSPMGQNSTAPRDKVSAEQGRRHLRSRLQMLVLIPVAAVAIIASCVVGMAYALSSSGRGQAIVWAIVLGVVIIVVAVLAARATIGTARSVLQPLYRIRGRALALAAGRPSDAAPADMASPDEIGDIARAVEQLGSSMSRLGGNEAGLRSKLDAMFVNVSHRSQSLVERQMRLIENLEQGEHDRGRRATLFRMDRIAARMHRDSQNLLVLAGHELSSGWNQPMVMTNVIRAAMSEVEEYECISVHAQPDVAVSAPVVNDMVHLLAELIQNATSFSAVDMPVEISGQLLSGGSVVISITDRGVGMSAQEMAHANWRLENPPASDIEVPKWIGLLVVARLAARHGVRVRLQQAEFGGLTALVWIPDQLIAREDATILPQFARSGPGGLRRGEHATAVDPRSAAAPPRMPATRAAELTASRDEVRSTPLDRRPMSAESPQPAPAPLAVSSPLVPQADPAIARPGGGRTGQLASAPLATAVSPQQETGFADSSVIVPPTGNPAEERRLPIFESVESKWFGDGRLASGSARAAVTAGSQWSSPADEGWRAAKTVESPAVGSSTEAGLPRRPPNANLVPGTIPAAHPAVAPSRSAADIRDRLSGFQRGATEGRAAASEAAKSAGDDEF